MSFLSLNNSHYTYWQAKLRSFCKFWILWRKKTFKVHSFNKSVTWSHLGSGHSTPGAGGRQTCHLGSWSDPMVTKQLSLNIKASYHNYWQAKLSSFCKFWIFLNKIIDLATPWLSLVYTGSRWKADMSYGLLEGPKGHLTCCGHCLSAVVTKSLSAWHRVWSVAKLVLPVCRRS